MKKKKLPKYVQEKFTKPQFKVGDRVKYEFLGEHGWGYITKINQYNDKISYMVQAKDYMKELGVHVEACANESSAAAMLGASINYPVRGAVTWKSIVGTNVASDALSHLASVGVPCSSTAVTSAITVIGPFPKLTV